MKYAFFSSSRFGKLVLIELLNCGFKPSLIISLPPKPAGRHQELVKNEIELLAEDKKIPVLCPFSLRDPGFLAEFQKNNFDFALVAGYGKIIPKELLNLLPSKFLNLHPSLLPRWRGASPIQSAILNGDRVTGVSLIIMDEQLDHGPILSRKEYDLAEPKPYPVLEEILAKIAAQLFIETIPLWLENKITPKVQDETMATYCSKIDFSQTKIDWQKSADEIWRQVLAFNPEPGTYTYLKSQIFKILSAEPARQENNNQLEPGTLFSQDKNLFIKCGTDSLKILLCQLAGRKPTTGYQFLLGHKDLLNEKAG